MGYVDSTLADRERVICRARLHWIVFAKGAGLGLLSLAGMIASAQATDPSFQIGARAFAGIVLIAAVAACVGSATKLLTTEIAATTRRFVVKRGRAVMEINAGQLESVAILQTLTGRLFGFGTLVVGGTGSGIDPVKNVAAPLVLRDAIRRIGRGAEEDEPPARRASVSADRIAVLLGDGKFLFPVVGESRHQSAIGQIAGARTREGARHYCVALEPRPDDPYDPSAVAVYIRGEEVGHLARDVVLEFQQALHRAGFVKAACEAEIVGGWDRGAEDRGLFGVRLNACRPFRFQSALEWQRDHSR